MERLSIHYGASERRFPGPPAVRHVGWMARKTEFIRHTFAACNFSVLVAGSGTYRDAGGVVRRVAAPCVLTQWPGEPMAYGPEPWWSELYVIYGPEHEPRLRASGLLDRRRWWWPVAAAARLRDGVDELLALMRGDPAAQADRIDRACERLVVESLLAAAAPPGGPRGAIAEIRRTLETDPSADALTLARAHGLSATHFRRLWLAEVGAPPARHLAQLRLRRACRLLAETAMPVREIAAEAGFADPLWFSRRFRAFAGMPPSAYRERYREETH